MSTPDPPEAAAENRSVPAPETSPAAGAPPLPSEEASFAEMLSAYEQEHHAGVSPGERLNGTVVGISSNGIIVDIGVKREGLLPLESFVDDGGRPTLKPGQAVTVSVTGRNQDGYYLLSTARVEVPKDWGGLERALSEKQAIVGTVVEVVKGGLRVDVGARAFLPASRSGTRDQAEMEALVGQEIRCRVIQLDIAKEDVVLDRRAILEEEAAAEREKAFAAIEEGAVVQGTVRSLTDFGAFVDVGGVDGLLHVTDLAWTRVDKPGDVLSVGQAVEVKILKVDRGARKISLGRKQLIPDPWSLAAGNYKVGERVQGKVVRLTDFGAFVQLEPGIDGLIHISEMSWSKKIRKPSDVLKRGESVEVVVLSVNPGDRRIGLGLKQALGDPWDEVQKKYPAGTVVEGKVANLAKFGAFVELEAGVEGMIHVGDITREKRLEHPNEVLKEGQLVRAAVVEVDPAKKRIRLSMKQLEPTSADEYIAEHKAGDVVTGRVVEAGRKAFKVELGDGVTATCRAPQKASEAGGQREEAARPDVSALGAMLAARWKAGSVPGGMPESGGVRAGEVRKFRILALDTREKRIEIELAE